MRSRQTGQVGSSISDGVGGARGLEVREVGLREVSCGERGRCWGVVVKGSCVFWGNAGGSWMSESGVTNSTDLMKTTWQFSGCDAETILVMLAHE